MTTQRQITSFVASGEVPNCSRCKLPPRHFFDSRSPQRGGGHFFECCPCDNRTGRHATPQLTNAEWRQRNGYAPATGNRGQVHSISRGAAR